MFLDNPNQQPNLSRPVNANEEFGLVYRSKLNNHYILYGAEVDGVDCPEPVPSDVGSFNCVKFVELKTSRHIQTAHQDNNFKKYIFFSREERVPFSAGSSRRILGVFQI